MNDQEMGLAIEAGRRRPVKLVQHPSFRGRGARPTASSLQLTVPLRIVVLNEATALDPHGNPPVFAAEAA